jgi:hypothetical protein
MWTFAHSAGISGIMDHQPAASRTDADMVRIAVMFAARAAAATAATLPRGFSHICSLRHALLHFQQSVSINFHYNEPMCILICSSTDCQGIIQGKTLALAVKLW